MSKKHIHPDRHNDKQFFIRLFVYYFMFWAVLIVGIGYTVPRMAHIAVFPTVGLVLFAAALAFLSANRCFKNIKTFGNNAGWKAYYIAEKIRLAKIMAFGHLPIIFMLLVFIFAVRSS